MRAACRFGLVLAATSVSLSAQRSEADPQRRLTFARVVDEAGAPLAGAVVTFAGCVPHLGPMVGPHDVQRVGADDRGRARAKLRDGLCYVAWAAREADGIGHVTPVVGYFGAGALLDLIATRCESPPRVQLSGAEAWVDRGPLRVFLTTPTPGIEHELEFVDGSVQVPLEPEWGLEVRTADGQPLWSTGSPAGSGPIGIPAPQRVEVLVVDEHGVPIQGAQLTQRIGRRSRWSVDGWTQTGEYVERQLGRTDANGAATVTICARGDLLVDDSQRELLLFASAPGRPPVAAGRYGRAFYVDDRKVAKAPVGVLRFTLRAIEPLVGHVGAVPPGTVAHLAAVCKLFSAQNSYFHDARTFLAPVAADGSVVFADVPPEVHSCHLTLLAPGGGVSLPLLPATAGRSLPLPAPDPEASTARLPRCELTLQIVDQLGGPPRGVIAVFVPGEVRGVLTRDAMVQLPLGAGGDLTVELLPGRWHVVAATSEGWVADTLLLERGPRSERMAMVPMSHLQVRLLGDDGEPVAGARVQQRGSSTNSVGDPMQPILQNLQRSRSGDWQRLRTDADGRVTIPFLPIEGHLRRLRLEIGERSTSEFRLEGSESPLELRLQ